MVGVRGLRSGALLLVAVGVLVLAANSPARRADAGLAWVVNTNSDADLSSCSGAANDCSLRGAINKVIAVNGAIDVIQFNIPPGGSQTINVNGTGLGALPTISLPMTIDATTQPGYAGAPLIELNGATVGANVSGLTVTANDVVIKGLVINRFTGNGILISGGDRAAIAGNYIGTNAAGTADEGNILNGISIASESGGNCIGGAFSGLACTASSATRNVISGNSANGVSIASAPTPNSIKSNIIGLNVAGTAELGNGHNGILIEGAPNNIIGDDANGAGNVISGNNRYGLYIHGTSANGNSVQNNRIGTNEMASAALGNGFGGVGVNQGDDTLIGGITALSSNVISGNTHEGIGINGGSMRTVIQGNLIGMGTGAVSVPNTGSGIRLYSSLDTTVGGPGSAANSIAYNGADGIEIGVIPGLNTGIRIKQNRIVLNGELGIDLGNDGVTLNDAGDADGGPNNFQNFPVIQSAVKDGAMLTISLTVDTTPNTYVEAFVYVNEVCDESGYGEGETPVTAANNDTDDQGHATFQFNLSSGIPVGSQMTAVAINGDGDTSEFSECVEVQGPATPTPVITPTLPATPTATAATGTITATPTITAAPTPTATATPSPTQSPVATPTVTPTPSAPQHLWGDSDCSGAISSRDNQALLREVLDQAPLSQTEPCPDIGSEVSVGGVTRIWGDWDCSGAISSRDNQALLRTVLDQPALSQTEPCPDIGET